MFLRSVIFAFAALLCATLAASPGYANTYYVAGNGSSTACTGAAPCPTLGQALAVAGVGDAILCVSPPLFSAVTITKSITIDCSGVPEAVRDTGTNTLPIDGIFINIAVSSNDPLRTVRLRGLTIDGTNPIGPGLSLDRGIEIQSANAVYIEDTVISNVRMQGIFDHRVTGQTKLFVTDTIVSGAGGAGIVTVAQSTGNVTVLDNFRSENNGYGIAVGTGNNVSIRNSVFSGNSVVGVEGDAGSHVVVRNSTISHNNIGVQSVSSVRIFNNDISFNNTAFSGSTGTMGLNMYSSNGSPGTTPMPIPNAPADIGP